MDKKSLMILKKLNKVFLIFIVLISLFYLFMNSAFSLDYVLPLNSIDYYNSGLELLYQSMPSQIMITGSCIDLSEDVTIHQFKINITCIDSYTFNTLNEWKSKFYSYLHLANGTYYFPIYALFVWYNETEHKDHYNVVRVINMTEDSQYLYLSSIPRIKPQGKLLNIIITAYNPYIPPGVQRALIGFFKLNSTGAYTYQFYHTNLERRTILKNQINFVVDLTPPTINYSISPAYSETQIYDALDHPLFDYIRFEINDKDSYVSAVKVEVNIFSTLGNITFEEDNKTYILDLYHKHAFFFLRRELLVKHFDFENLFSNSDSNFAKFNLSITVIATDKYNNKKEETFNFSYYVFKRAFYRSSIPTGVDWRDFYVLNASEWQDRDNRLKISLSYDFGNLSSFVDFGLISCDVGYVGENENGVHVDLPTFEFGINKYNYEYSTNSSLGKIDVFLPLLQPFVSPDQKLSLFGEYSLFIRIPFGNKILDDSFKLIFDNESPKIEVYLENDKYGTKDYGVLHPGDNVGYSFGDYGLFKIRFDITDDLLMRGYYLPYKIKLEGNSKFLSESDFICNATSCVFDLYLLNENGTQINSQREFDSTYGNFKDLKFNVTVIDPSGKRYTIPYHIYVAKEDPIMVSFDLVPSLPINDDLVEDYYNMPMFEKIRVKVWDHFSKINDANFNLYYTLLNNKLNNNASNESYIIQNQILLKNCVSSDNAVICELSRAELFNYLDVDSKFKFENYTILNYSLIIEGYGSNEWNNNYNLYQSLMLIIHKKGVGIKLTPAASIFGRFFIYNISEWNVGLVHFKLNKLLDFSGLNNTISNLSEYYLNVSICRDDNLCKMLDKGNENWNYNYESYWQNYNLSVNISIPTHSKIGEVYDMKDHRIELDWDLRYNDTNVFTMKNYVLFDKKKPNLSISVIGDKWGSDDVGVVRLGYNANFNDSAEPMGTFVLKFDVDDDLLNRNYALPYLIKFENNSQFFDRSSFTCYFKECLIKVHLVDPENHTLLYSNVSSQYTRFLELYEQRTIPLRIKLIDPSGKEVEVHYTLKILKHDEINLEWYSYPAYNEEFIDGLNHKVFSQMGYNIRTTFSKLKQVKLTLYYDINDHSYMKEFTSPNDLNVEYYKMIFDHDMLISLYNFSDLLKKNNYITFPLTIVLTIKDDWNETIQRSKHYQVRLYRDPYQKIAQTPPGVFMKRFLLMNSSVWDHKNRLKLTIVYNFTPIFNIMNFTNVTLFLSHQEIDPLEIGSNDYNYDYNYSINKNKKLIILDVWLPVKTYTGKELDYSLPYQFRIYFVNNFGYMIDDFDLLFDFDKPRLIVIAGSATYCDGRNYCVLIIGKDINTSDESLGDFNLNLYLYDDLLVRSIEEFSVNFSFSSSGGASGGGEIVRNENMRFSYLVNVVGEDSFLLSQNRFIMTDFNLSKKLYLTNDSLKYREGSLTAFLYHFQNRVLHLFFNVVDPVGKRDNFEYLLYVLDSSVVGNEPIYVNKVVDHAPFDVTYIFNLGINELSILHASCDNDLNVSWEGKTLHFRGNYTGYKHFDCSVRWNVGFESKLNVNILVDENPPKLKLISSKIEYQNNTYIYNAQKFLSLEDYIYVPKDVSSNVLRFEVSDDNLPISKINISIDGVLYKTFDNVNDLKSEFYIDRLALDKITITLSDKINNTITYTIHVKRYDVNVRYVPSSINSPSNLRFIEMKDSQEGCDLAYKFLWAQDNVVNLMLYAEDPVLNSTELEQILSVNNGVNFKINALEGINRVYFNITLYDITKAENLYHITVSDIYGIPRAIVCFNVNKLSDENILILDPNRFSDLPKNITFHFNKPVDYCVAKARADGTDEPYYTFALTPVNGTQYDMQWLNADEGLKELIRFDHENMQYVVEVNCTNYFLNKHWNFVSYFVHDNTLGSAKFTFENVLIKDSWQKMSDLISHPNNLIKMSISSDEPLRCWYIIDNVTYNISSTYVRNRITMFYAPSEPGKYLIPVYCEDELGNKGLYHIIFLNVTNTPFVYRITNILSDEVALEIETTKDGLCYYNYSGAKISRVLMGDSVLKIMLGVKKTNPLVECELANGYSFTINLSKYMNDNFFKSAYDEKLLQLNDSYLKSISIYRPSNVFSYVKDYEELNLILRNTMGVYNMTIPSIPENVQLITKSLDLITEKNDECIDDLDTINESLVSGIILHPKDLFLYPYVVFELFAKDVLNVLPDVHLKLDSQEYDLNKCRFMISRYGTIFSCPVENYSDMHTIALYYKDELLDEKQVPKTRYFGFNLVPGSYRYRIFDVGMSFRGKNYVSEPKLMLIQSGTNNIQENMLGNYVTYFTYNQSTNEFRMDIVYRLDFSSLVSEGEQKKFVVIAESYPYISNVVPLFIDLRPPELEK